MALETKCVVCKREDASIVTGEPYLVRCKQCGIYHIHVVEYKQMLTQVYDPLFSAWLRNRTEDGSPVPNISGITWDRLKASFRTPSAREKQAAFMKALGRRTSSFGATGHYQPGADFTLAWASNEGELHFLVQDLIARRLLDRASTIRGSFLITLEGWDYLDSLPVGGVFSDQVFVAMSFSERMRPAWENAIAPAIRRAGYTPYRVDATPHIERIDHKIMVEIKSSRFVIADVTEQKAGVYFEAGYAIGQGLPVFWAVHNDDLANVHFDTRQYAHIVWRTEADLAAKLYDFIVAIVGPGKSKSMIAPMSTSS